MMKIGPSLGGNDITGTGSGGLETTGKGPGGLATMPIGPGGLPMGGFIGRIDMTGGLSEGGNRMP